MCRVICGSSILIIVRKVKLRHMRLWLGPLTKSFLLNLSFLISLNPLMLHYDSLMNAYRILTWYPFNDWAYIRLFQLSILIISYRSLNTFAIDLLISLSILDASCWSRSQITIRLILMYLSLIVFLLYCLEYWRLGCQYYLVKLLVYFDHFVNGLIVLRLIHGRAIITAFDGRLIISFQTIKFSLDRLL